MVVVVGRGGGFHREEGCSAVRRVVHETVDKLHKGQMW